MKNFRTHWMLASLLALTACGEVNTEPSHACDHDHAAYETTRHALAQPGRWIPPDDVLAIANEQSLPYSGAPTSCSGNLQPGTRDFAEFLKREFDGATSYGGYACRANTANPSQYSVHASGRAIDLFVPLDGGEADNDLGDPIANYLIMNAEQIGVEFVVWDRTSWGAHRSAPKHRAYTGPHPHHDHLHIELRPASASATGQTFPPVVRDTPPTGWMDAADCDAVQGWTQDPDAPDQPIEVYISIGGPVFTEGAAGYFVLADQRRDDLCDAIGSCDHGFQLPFPRGLMDGTSREVYAYGMDATGPQNAELDGGPKSVQCDPPTLPFDPDYGVRRHVPNPETLAAWGFDTNDIAAIADDDLAQLPLGAPLGGTPRLVRRTGEDAVYLVDEVARRHVPSAAAMASWRFDWNAIEEVTDFDDTPEGPALQPRPFLAKGSGPEVYLVVPPRPHWADNFQWRGPTQLGRGQTTTLELSLRNRGAAKWEPPLFELRGCDQQLDVATDPTETADLSCTFTAPDAVGPTQFCVQPVLDGWEFDERACLDIEVLAEPVDLGSSEPDARPMVIDGRGGCTTAPNPGGAWWLLIALAFVRRRPRRS